MTPNPPGNSKHDQDSDNEIESMKEILEPRIFVPLLAQLLTCVCEPQTPGQRAREGIDDEFFQIHARDACGKCDERPNRRQQAANENDRFTKSIKPAISEIQIMMRNQKVLAILLD